MKTKPLFTPTADGYDIQPGGVLIMLASYVYGHESGLSDSSRAGLKHHVDSILTAARAGGFTQCDILATLVSRNEVSHRIKAMAVQAEDYLAKGRTPTTTKRPQGSTHVEFLAPRAL